MHKNSNAANPYAGETNPLPVSGAAYHDVFHKARAVDWKEPGLRVTRFRMVSDPGFPLWDVTYCHGYLGEEPVHVILPFSQLRKKGFRYRKANGSIGLGGWKAHLIAWAKREGVDVRKLGILNAASTLN